MFLGVLNAVFLNISNYLPHLVLRNRSIQIVVILNAGIKRFDCITIQLYHDIGPRTVTIEIHWTYSMYILTFFHFNTSDPFLPFFSFFFFILFSLNTGPPKLSGSSSFSPLWFELHFRYM